MLRIVQNASAAGAKSYYSAADYYTEGQELQGEWRGLGADRLSLTGAIRKQDWDALADNRHPATGTVLTARQKDNRRIGYDFNFHVPKSVSVLYALTNDERILDAFRDSVNATMQDMEAEMKTRVRAGGRNEDRTTGNMVWGEFVHFTARPVGGVPDPHLHAHCFVFNTTWDSDESRWKAGQFADLKRDAPYFEAVFHSRLAYRLHELGLPVERTKRGWELCDIPSSAIKTFSRRTTLIEKAAQEQGITDAELKGELGARTRERKRKALSLDDLRREWSSRLSPSEMAAVTAAAGKLAERHTAEDERLAGHAVGLAIDHCFERSSVVAERRLLTEALKRSLGTALPETVNRLLDQRDLVTAVQKGERLTTTPAVLDEERRMIAFARQGRGACPRLGETDHAFKRDWLNAGQRKAVQHVLDSRDRVTLIRGAAGTGKTAMMQEAAEAISDHGKQVFTFAPSADASRGVLRHEGFVNADTVARLLLDEQLQKEIEGQVVWIDEAGLLGTKAMGQVFDLADRLDARVILSGDRRQHGSVERGAALRLLEEEAGLRPAEIREIQRQKSEYKQAVQALSDGRTETGFRQLDQLGWVHEISASDRYKFLADAFVGTVEAGKTALVVSPTHREGDRITAEIRAQLKAAGKLGKHEYAVPVLENANLTQADRMDPVNYTPDDVLVFHQNAKGYTKGDRVAVGAEPLPLDQASRFNVFHPRNLSLAAGDIVRVTKNGTTADGVHRLNNGGLHRVRTFAPNGDIVLANGWMIAKDFGHLDYGYVVTSHASQGKTVDRVFIGQSAESYLASSKEQFYVSASRGREQVQIFTDDKAALREAISKSNDRLSGTELIQCLDHARYRIVNQTITEDRRTEMVPAIAQAPSREARDHER